MQQKWNGVVLDDEVPLVDVGGKWKAVELRRLKRHRGGVVDNASILAIARACDLGERSASCKVHDRVIEFSTYRASAKVKNLVREGAGSVLAVADGPDGRRMLLAEGTVSLAEGPRHLGDPRAGAGATGEVPAEILSTVARSHESGKRVVLELHLTRARFVTGEMASR